MLTIFMNFSVYLFSHLLTWTGELCFIYFLFILLKAFLFPGWPWTWTLFMTFWSLFLSRGNPISSIYFHKLISTIFWYCLIHYYWDYWDYVVHSKKVIHIFPFFKQLFSSILNYLNGIQFFMNILEIILFNFTQAQELIR